MEHKTITVDGNALTLSGRASSAEAGISDACFDNEIPPFVEPVLNNLYGALYSNTPRYRIYGGAENASTYIIRRNQDIVALFLFRKVGRQIRVINEGITVDDASVARFAEYVFNRYPDVDMLIFNAVDSTVQRLRYPFQQYNCTEDSIITLPSTPEEYLNNFGKSVKRNLKYYLNRLKREFPGFEYRIHEGSEVDEKIIRELVRFNRMRFANRKKVSAITAEEEERIIRMVRACGIIGAATIDGTLVAGSVTYKFGDHYHSWIKTHNPAYDDYRFGIILTYMMACECIRRGGKALHLLWGRQPQKTLLQGVHYDRQHLTVYRSAFAAVRHSRVVTGNIYRDYTRRTKLYLLALEKEDSPKARVVHAVIDGLRGLKARLSGF